MNILVMCSSRHIGCELRYPRLVGQRFPGEKE